MSNIQLTAGIRSGLTQLNQTAGQFDQVTSRLASGKRVNSAIDNPTNFFASVNLNDRASGLSSRLDGMGQAIQRIQAADNGISSVRSILSAMTGVVNNALGNTDSDARQALGEQFNELINQVNTTAKDSAYAGVNLIQNNGATGDTETVQFNETFGGSTLAVDGFNVQGESTVSSSGTLAADLTGVDDIKLGTAAADSNAGAALVIATQDSATAVGIQGYSSGGAGQTINWGGSNYASELGAVIAQIEAFDAELKTQAGGLATNLSTITTREEFTTNMINTLEAGADALVLADLNEEGANLLALQTQNQLATQSLSLASQQSQSVLQLIG